MSAQETKPQRPRSAARRRLSPATLAVVAVLLAALFVSWRVSVWQRQVRLNHALIQAVNKDNTLAAERLLNEGADPNTRDGYRAPASWPVRVWDKLRHRQPPPPILGYPVLFTAINDKDYAMVKDIAAHGADVNVIGDSDPDPTDRTTALTEAEGWDTTAPSFSLSVAKILIARGVDVNTEGFNGETPLTRAQNAEEVRLLINAGANVNAQDSLYDTPLISAVLFEFPDHANQHQINTIIQELLAAGADINARDNVGRTTLMLACHYGLTSTVKLLLQRRARLDFRDTYNEEDALDFVTKSEFAQPKAKREIIAMLVQAERKQNAHAGTFGKGTGKR